MNLRHWNPASIKDCSVICNFSFCILLRLQGHDTSKLKRNASIIKLTFVFQGSMSYGFYALIEYKNLNFG